MKTKYIAILTRAGYAFHDQVLWGLLDEINQRMESEWRPILFFCKEPRPDVMREQMNEIKRHGKYDLIISIGALYSNIAKTFCERENWFDTPIVFGGVAEPVELGVLSTLAPERNITGVLREQVCPTQLSRYLLQVKPMMKKVVVPYYLQAELGFLEKQLLLFRDFLAGNGVEVLLVPVSNMQEVVPKLRPLFSRYDTFIFPEGAFASDLTKYLGELACQFGVTFVSHHLDAAKDGAAITFAQDVRKIGVKLFEQAEQILTYEKTPNQVELALIPDKRRVILNADFCRKQNVCCDEALLFVLKSPLIYY